jgi:N-acetylglucosamine kinase-like BadF-type ATPase
MNNVYIFEAGGTSTSLVHYNKDKQEEWLLPGFNPNRAESAFSIALNDQIAFQPGATIYFYGSGLGNDKNKAVLKELFDSVDYKSINIYDDITAGAHAAFRKEAGVVCIMGTGGLAAYYDGKRIIDRRGGHGYLIDDIGGGLELGKRIISAWLNGDFSDEISAKLEEHLEMNKDVFVQKFYLTKKLKTLSTIVKMMVEYKKDPVFANILDIYFSDFIRNNVVPLSIKYNCSKISLVGSVGFGYYDCMKIAAKKFDIQINQCIQNPIQRLLDFHLSSS